MLRDYQQHAVDNCREAFRKNRGVLLVVPTGGGKCHRFNTPILMHDGSIKPVQEIRKGDALMGPDSKPRQVLSTCVGHGRMFEVIPIKGEPWGCNESHVLTLVSTVTNKVIDIPLDEYLTKSKAFKHEYKLFCVGVEFPQQEPLPLEPYFLGLWFGDGTKNLKSVEITKADKEIPDEMKRIASKYGGEVKKRKSKDRCPTWAISTPRGQPNQLLSLMRQVVGEDRSIPKKYLTACREDRLQLLAGLLDTDGHTHNGAFEIVQKRKDYADSIMFLAKSLGFRALCSKKNVNDTLYWRISISGDCSKIPTRIPRKRAAPRLQNKDVLRTGFKVREIEPENHYGFELSGDGRYLLGSFMVTHNTVIGANIAERVVENGGRVIWLTHRRELVHQAARKLKDAGIIMAGVKRRDSPIQVASVQSFVQRKPVPASLIICDEAHHAVASTWRGIIENYPHAKILGLTATPQRSDGSALGDIFNTIVKGPSVQHLTDAGHLVPCEVFGPNFETEALSMDPVDAWRMYAGDCQGFIFCSSVMQSQRIARKLGSHAEHVDGSTPLPERDAIIQDFRRGGVRVLCSVQVFTEGTDLPMASVAVIARGCSHPSTYLQMVGRVLRPAPGKTIARIVDLRGAAHRCGLPADEREYSLTGAPIKQVSALPMLRQCPACGAVWRAGRERKPCFRCGHEMPEIPMPKVKEQRIGPLRPSAGADEKRWRLQQLIREARAKGYKIGWAYAKHKAIYGG